MQQIVVDLIVAAAALFLARWMFRNFVAKRPEQPACGNCPQCATSRTESAAPAGAATVQSKG
jgi:hypothetical protein